MKINFLSVYVLILIGCIDLITSCSAPDPQIKQEKHISSEDSIKHIRAEINAKQKEQILKHYFDSLAQYQDFNGNVLIAQRGQVIFKGEYGYSDFKTKDTLKPQSVFQLASITKQFTATCILKLYEEGKLNLQDSIQKFFPDFPYHGITIHLLLTHRSGLPNYMYFADELLKNKNTYLSNNFIINAFTEYHPQPYYPPDVTFDYSNTGYAILALIVEKVSGMNYDEYVQKNIFNPLKMTDSFVYNRNKNTYIPTKTTGYLYGSKPAADNIFNGVVGDKGIYTCVDDLFKWDRSLYTDKIITRQSRLLTFKPMGKSEDSKHNYGYGWRMYTTDDGLKVTYHGGWWQGYQNLYVHLEKDSSAVIILKNVKTGYPFNHKELLKILYNSKSQKL